MKKHKTKLLTLVMIAVWALVSITPPITPSVTAKDYPEKKNKFLTKGCKPKAGHVCETGGDDDGLIRVIIDTIF